MSKFNPLNSFVYGFMRKAGFTAANRTTEAIGRKILNPKSKLRKKLEKFELTGDFNPSYKKMLTLIEVFYEEYCINPLPAIQIGTYFQSDVNSINYKLNYLVKLIENQEQSDKYDILSGHWEEVLANAKSVLGIE